MARRRPHVAILSPFDLFFLGVAFILAWSWDTAVSAWNLAPVLASQHLAADPRLLRVDDLPPGGLAALLDVVPSSSLPGRLADDLWADRYVSGFAPLQRAIVAVVVEERIDRDSQMLLLLNTLPMGNLGETPVRGLDEASMAFFGKRCTELDTQEFHTLVSMIAPDGAPLPPLPEPPVALARG
jgi:hypothetical protein